MNGRNKTARVLVGLGCLVLLASAAIHLLAAFTRLSPALTASNLNAVMQSGLRTVFLLVGWDWIVIAIILLIAAFTEARVAKAIVLVCGFALLVQTGVMLAFLGWFVGTDLIFAAALLVVGGGFAFAPAAAQIPTQVRAS
jgi:hypothetical protein